MRNCAIIHPLHLELETAPYNIERAAPPHPLPSHSHRPLSLEEVECPDFFILKSTLRVVEKDPFCWNSGS